MAHYHPIGAKVLLDFHTNPKKRRRNHQEVHIHLEKKGRENESQFSNNVVDRVYACCSMRKGSSNTHSTAGSYDSNCNTHKYSGSIKIRRSVSCSISGQSPGIGSWSYATE